MCLEEGAMPCFDGFKLCSAKNNTNVHAFLYAWYFNGFLNGIWCKIKLYDVYSALGAGSLHIIVYDRKCQDYVYIKLEYWNTM